LKPMRAFAEYSVDGPDGPITGGYLSGEELEKSIKEAVGSGEYDKLAYDLVAKGFVERRDQATGMLADVPGRDSFLVVSIPFDGRESGESAQIKYLRNGSNTEIGTGILYNKGDSPARIDVYEVVSGNVKHTSTLKIRDGRLIEEPVGASSVLGDSVSPPENDVNISKCTICNTVCAAYNAATCGLARILACNLICVPIGAAACPVICFLLFVLLCSIPTTKWNCPVVCGPTGLKFCS